MLKKITPELLLEQLSDDDFDVIDAEIENIKKKADARESQLAGYRAAVLALGRHGITEARIAAMTRPELDGYLNALAVLNGGKPAADKAQSGNTRVIKSMRKKRNKRGK
ncbi:hypothetical protein [Dickeya oryzae]